MDFPIQWIKIRGAREHNLKHVDVDIPHRRLTVITGVSGSGKTSLAYDTLYAEGQRRFVENLSTYARQFLGKIEKPKVELKELRPRWPFAKNRSTPMPVPRWGR